MSGAEGDISARSNLLPNWRLERRLVDDPEELGEGIARAPHSRDAIVSLPKSVLHDHRP